LNLAWSEDGLNKEPQAVVVLYVRWEDNIKMNLQEAG
jgi:hypothetical protein